MSAMGNCIIYDERVKICEKAKIQGAYDIFCWDIVNLGGDL